METVTDSGGRVTRGLRKRVTSIDSDNNSSRPGTPVQSKIAANTKMSTDSPLKPRMTRRNSTSGVATPVKTPAKRAAAIATITETDVKTATASPARRTTRRRSTSSVENDGPTQPPGSKAPNFDTLLEEQETTRVTRSKSKSPQQIKTEPGTKNTTKSAGSRKSLRGLSVAKVENEIVQEKIGATQNKISPQKMLRVSISRDKSLTKKINDMEQQENIDPLSDKQDKSNIAKEDQPEKQLEQSTSSGDKDKEIVTEKDAQNIEEQKQQKEQSDATTQLEEPQMEVTEKEETPMQVENKADQPNDLQNEEELNKTVEMGQEKDVQNEENPKNTNELLESKEQTAEKPSEAVFTPSDQNEEKVDGDPENSTAAETINEQSSAHKTLDQSCNVLPMDEDDDQSLIVPETQEATTELETISNSKETNDDIANNVVDLKPKVSDSNPDEMHSNIEETSNNVSVKDEILDEHVPSTNEVQAEPNENEPMDKDDDDEEPETEEMCKTPSPKKNKSLSKVQIATPMQSSTKTRSVAFNSVASDDECEKSIFPKTPGSAKSKSFIEMDSSFKGGDGDDSVVSVDDASDEEIPETQQQVEKIHSSFAKKTSFVEPKDEMETEDITMEDDEKPEDEKQKNEETENSENKLEEDEVSKSNSNLKSSLNSSIRRNESVEDDSSKLNTSTRKSDSGAKKSLNSSTRNEDKETSLKWCNPSVTNKNDGNAKLDTIASERKPVSEATVVTKEKSAKKKQKFLKRAEWNSDDEDAADDDDEADEDEALLDDDEDVEAPYRRKHSFHDDQAMVADDYESGDSMDSEERREMLENEIPVDGESIGSHTTDEEDNDGDEEESENDSFIVSDDELEDGGLHEEEEENTDSDDEEEEDDANELEHSKDSKKKKSYKRIQRPQDDDSSSSEEEPEPDLDKENSVDYKVNEKDIENNSLNNSKLSDSALRLQCNGDENQSSSTDQDTNKSRKEILRKLNQSDRFNKSVRDLDPDVDASPEVDKNVEEKQQESSADGEEEENELPNKKKQNDEAESEGEEHTNSKNSSILVMRVNSSEEDAENEEEETNADDDDDEEDEEMADEGDNDDSDMENEAKENESERKSTAANKVKHHNRGLSVSFGHFKSQKKDSLQKRVLQRSFTIGVRISGGEVDTAVIEAKPCSEESNASANPSSSSSANDEETDDTTGVLSTEDIRYLENYKPMPLGNPLVRTKRQSLALPTNPDIELCNSSLGIAMPAKKPKRKSLAVLSGNEFNPSQSFVHSLELRKAEYDGQSTKRKRLSKSFCATSEGLDASIIDLDARHLHKRSKLSLDGSLVDSLENLSSSKANSSSKVKHSSTPHEKANVAEKSDNSIRRILNRCDEILEAANRAKLEAKLNYKKSKVKMPKKNKKKAIQRLSSSPESKQKERIFAPLSKDFKRKDKVKRASAVKRALRASANIIIGKPIKIIEEDDSQEENNNINIMHNNDKAESIKSKAKKSKKTPLDEHCRPLRNYATAAGKVIETLRTPEKKKKPKEVIHLPTGKVCVEPITPTKRTILTCNGMEFHESPATPYGFNIQFSALDTPQFPVAMKDRKRKRNIEEAKKKTFPKPQWTQSGMFVEEEIPGTRASQLTRAIKKQQNMPHCSGYNFKQNALFRADIKRSTTREMLQLRERRPLHSNY
ncbi:protein slender lobes isoform X1 [Musca domestica]|uniref:Protein slender lobes isoform X1 n=1 Tax=Musca domestica TaxID=7370 RepID=A0A9J7I182_MUSDO|nr:protein slender lobes isoform X1 [Musca domestica]